MSGVFGQPMFRAAAPGRGSHSDDLVLVVGGEDGLHCLLGREGSLAEEAGAGVSFAAYSHCFLNNLAEALYGAVYAGPGITTANRTAVYFGRYDAAHESLRDANPAPTFPTGVSLTGVAAMMPYGDIVGPTTDGTFGFFRVHLPVVPGDADVDGDVDVDDWALMPDCCGGDSVDTSADCAILDLDADGDVDLADQALFQQLFP